MKVWELSSRFESSHFALAHSVGAGRHTRSAKIVGSMKQMKTEKILQLSTLLLVFLIGQSSFGSEVSGTQKTPKTMHGIQLSDYGDFEKKWKLVTVRFRKDTGELRFTYANDMAWRHLKKVQPSSESARPYPKGSVFAKVGIATAEDPAFVSSAVPNGVRRVQFMVRDEKKFSETDGWGYALFDSDGHTFPGDLTQASIACAACHKLVPDRGYVFSQFMTGLAPLKSGGLVQSRLHFETKSSRLLPDEIQLHLPPKTKEVQVITGELARHVFPGTLDEVRPALTREALRSGRPAMLLSEKDRTLYSIVYSTNEVGTCAAGQIQLMGIMNTTEKAETVQSIRFCEGERK